MQLPVFEHAYLLQSIGWAIANSFWQAGSLWLFYQLLTSVDKKLPAVVKHHVSIVLLLTSFVWFIVTAVQNYLVLAKTTIAPAFFPGSVWLPAAGLVNRALPYLSLIYLLMLFGYALRFIGNLSGNRLLQTNGLIKAPLDLRLFTTRTGIHLGIKKKVGVWISGNVDVPSVTGFIMPVILLPAAVINHLSIRQTETILLHELAHIRRHDYLMNLLQSVVEMMLFFNPFAVLLGKTAREERENCCADWVMNFQYDQHEYARALLVLEEQRDQKTRFNFAIAATNGRKNLLQRIKRLFNTLPQTYFSPAQKIKLAGLCLVLLAGIIALVPGMSLKPSLAKGQNEQRTRNTVPPEIAGNVKTIEHPSVSVITSPPQKKAKEIVIVDRPKAVKKKAAAPESNYVNAYINEELLGMAIIAEPVVTLVTQKEAKDSTLLIRVEEQESGKRQIITYYFELKNNDGNTSIKPLIILNQVNTPAKKPLLNRNADSLKSLKKIMLKRKITT